MKSNKLIKFFTRLGLLCALLLSAGLPQMTQSPVARADVAAPQATPTVLVDDIVSSYSLSGPKLFWHNDPFCETIPHQQSASPQSSPLSNTDQVDDEVVARVATYGSPVRQ